MFGLFRFWKERWRKRHIERCDYFYDDEWVYVRTHEKDIVRQIDESRFSVVFFDAVYYKDLRDLTIRKGMPLPKDGSLRIQDED